MTCPDLVPISAPSLESGRTTHGQARTGYAATFARIHGWTVSNSAKVVAVVTVIFLAQVCLAMSGTSPVYDEDLLLTAGYTYWKFQDGTINHNQPPLVKVLAAVPLLVLNPQISSPPTSDRQNDFDPFVQDFFRRNSARLDLILFLGRLPMAVLAAMLGVAIYAWAREAFGSGVALFALVLYAFEPNFLGHAGLVFPDAPLAALSLGFVFALWRWCQRPGRPQMLIAGVLLGLALLTKTPAIALIPLAIVLTGLHVKQDPRRNATVLRYARGLLGIHLAAGMLFLAVYGAFFGAEYIARPGEPSRALDALLTITRRSPQEVRQPVEAAVRYLAEHVPVVGLDFLRGVHADSTRMAGLGMPSFLFGHYSDHGWSYFHFAVFGLKTTTPMLILIGLRLLLVRRLPWHQVEVFLAIPAFAVMILSAASPLAGGVRYILPAYPFLILLLARLWTARVNARGLWVGLLIVLLSWHALSALRTYPHYLAFFNELTGGPSRGYEYLVGANLDFGQESKRLAAYLHSRGMPPVYLSLHTTMDPTLYGIRYLPLPPDGRCRTGVVAISATHLQGVPFENRMAFAWLKRLQPSAVIGHAVFVYDVERCPEARAWREATP